MFSMYDGKEVYSVNAAARIGRPAMNLPPVDRWVAVALVVMGRNGRFKETIPFAKWEDFIKSNPEWYLKNGNMKYHLMDIDCGTTRIWGRGVKISLTT